MSYLCDLFFIFIFIFIMINHIISHAFFRHFLEYFLLVLDDNVDRKFEYFLNSKNIASGRCLAFARFFANFSLVFLIKVLLIKKTCNIKSKIIKKISLRLAVKVQCWSKNLANFMQILLDSIKRPNYDA